MLPRGIVNWPRDLSWSSLVLAAMAESRGGRDPPSCQSDPRNRHEAETLGGRCKSQPGSQGQGGALRPGETLGTNPGLPQDPTL